MKHRGSFSFGVLAIEMVSISIAVVLGFAVNEWRASIADDVLAENALTAIASEVQFNHLQLTKRIEYFQHIVSQVDSLERVHPDRVVTEDELEGWTGAALPLVRHASYDVLISTGAITIIPFETANQISTMYAVQGFVEHVVLTVMRNFMTPPEQSLESAIFMLRRLIDIAPPLIQMYEEVGETHLSAYGYVVPSKE